MKFVVLTLFKEMFDAFVSTSIIKRAIDKDIVSIDVLDIRESEDFEVFGEGKDSGIDGRAENKKGKIIVQAKICNYSFNVLLRKLQKEELPKVRKLKPNVIF